MPCLIRTKWRVRGLEADPANAGHFIANQQRCDHACVWRPSPHRLPRVAGGPGVQRPPVPSCTSGSRSTASHEAARRAIGVSLAVPCMHLFRGQLPPPSNGASGLRNPARAALWHGSGAQPERDVDRARVANSNDLGVLEQREGAVHHPI